MLVRVWAVTCRELSVAQAATRTTPASTAAQKFRYPNIALPYRKRAIKKPRAGAGFFIRPDAFRSRSTAERPATLARALRPFLCFVDTQRPAVHLKTVQALDRRLGFRLGHLDETEAARFTGLAVVDEFHRIHLAVAFKQSLDVLLGGIEGQIAHVNRRHS